MQAQGKSAFTNRLQRLFHQPSNRRANNRNRWLLLPLLMLPLLLTAALAAQRNEPSAVRETTSTTAENAETALYFLDDQRYPSMESLQLKLGPNAYLQACGEADEELKRINAAEAAGYTTIMRFYNGGVPLDDGHTGIFEQINPTEEETMETETFYNGERLDASGEQAMVAGIMVAQSENSAGLNMAYFIDDVPVNGSLDENDAITVTGSVLHYDNEASAVTKALNQRQNTQYDGVVKMDTAEEGAAVTQNAAMAIQANDSILYLVNDVPYEQLDISRIPPEAIEIINVKKQVNYPSGALDKKYLGVVEIRLKPGYDMEDFLRKIEPGKQGRSEVELRHEKDLQDMFGGKLEFSNIVLFVDGERRKTADIQKLKAEGIESVEVIKDAKQLKALGFQEYEAVIKIFTLKGKQ